MPVTVSITGQREVRAALAKLARMAPEKLKGAIAESTINIHGEARRNVTTDVGFLKSSINFEVTSGGLTGEVRVNSNYGPYVEFGTRPHFPPVEPLEEWARRHGMPPGTGFLIARKIARFGTPAQPFLFPAAEAERNPFVRAVRDALIQAARESATR
jgi:HK97 gp10 family phage protein